MGRVRPGHELEELVDQLMADDVALRTACGQLTLDFVVPPIR